jgi:hypothetical protein
MTERERKLWEIRERWAFRVGWMYGVEDAEAQIVEDGKVPGGGVKNDEPVEDLREPEEQDMWDYYDDRTRLKVIPTDDFDHLSMDEINKVHDAVITRRWRR